MNDALQASLKIASSGMEVQSTRLRVISENVANAESTGQTPGADPYTRKTISFDNEMDRASGIQTVRVKRIGLDDQPFKMELDAGNPAADEKGFVKMPNVNLLVELADMREANRSYEANLQVVKQSGDLTSMTIGLLKD
ncbi:flagellar basal body rod protein FlgC [Methylocapsa sp. S129]|uniref:flagellar basal body rod protein FlgC n=1 Tax=Methylocapsa sp. S129 TaxID=1641869 RepID=UPI00131BABB2|nr:flagellar basal body rod protein FlgC [Methylocapsa sp. S129]